MDYWSDTRYDVSIHTRHYWRVKQRTRIPGPARRHVSIHTRHYWRVKRARQSTLICGLLRFNPHPPLLAGETSAPAIPSPCNPVSIHTRHYWRVKQHRENLASYPIEVSIHTRHYWRVKLARTMQPCHQYLFQSTPAITGG